MGLFVVSRLAERHGIQVELKRNGQGGTTATVLLPTAILPGLPAERRGPATTVPTAPFAEPAFGGPRLAGVPADGLPTRPRLGSVLDELPRPAPAPVVPAAAPRSGPVLEPPPAPLDPLVAPLGALDRSRGEDDRDAPIFRSLRSAWLSAGGEAQPWTTSEVEAGWVVAEKAVQAPTTQERTPSGLPLRRPGAHLVPGGVTKQATRVARDPEAVKSRLAAHAAGVSRGRHAAAASATRTTAYHPHTEADPA
jgi:hypothetical protein